LDIPNKDIFSYYRQLQSDLRVALERNQFCLNYQPIFDITSKKIRGFEALIRWNHPVQGILRPGSFLGLLDTNNHLIKIGHWAIEQACLKIAYLRRKYQSDLTIAVNVSVSEFVNPSLSHAIEQCLIKAGIQGEALDIELTENKVFEPSLIVYEQFAQLKQLGVGISIDDFGIGYSSLYYLNLFPIDKIKIDRSFFLYKTKKEFIILQSLIDLAHKINITTLAEGIETEEELELLKSMGCHQAQGYFLSLPLDESELEQFIKTYQPT
jgi:EAL domain-containing protein (putative c-di-GMP-specific phosphodiesterase class I)